MPTPFANLGFEIAGTNPGDAASWTYTFLATGEILAAINPSPDRPAEDFERGWSIDGYLFVFDPDDSVDLTQALYSGTPGPGQFGEQFENGWDDNQGFAFTLIDSELAAYGPTMITTEGFERDWRSNDGFFFDWDLTSNLSGIFNTTSDLFEGFEREWDSNESYLFAVGGLSVAIYYPDSLSDPFDNFENVQIPRPFSVDTSMNLVIAHAHGLSDGNIVLFVAAPDGVLPSGLGAFQQFFVINSTTNNFQVATTLGGTAQPISTEGFGTNFYKNDPLAFWTLEMVTV